MIAEKPREDWIALPSAVRTVTTETADILLGNSDSLGWLMEVTAASGTGGVQVSILYQMPSGTWSLISSFGVALTTTGRAQACVGAGLISNAGSGPAGEYPLVLPAKVRLRITHSDASNYTYSLEVWKK